MHLHKAGESRPRASSLLRADCMCRLKTRSFQNDLLPEFELGLQVHLQGEKIPSIPTHRTGERPPEGPFEMPFIVWTSAMSVDVKLLDNDHKKLAILINDLHEGVMSGCAREPLERIFDELVAFSRAHFYHEEHLLDEAGYIGAAAHKHEHGHKMDLVRMMQARFRMGRIFADDLEVLNQLRDWLVNHIQDSDQEFVAHLKAAGVNSILAKWNEPDGDA